MSDLVERMAKAICAEKCAYRGEPSCAVVMEGTAYRFPPETCCEPGCLAEARAACGVVALVRKEALEEAAKVAEGLYQQGQIGGDIAAAIRKLGEE